MSTSAFRLLNRQTLRGPINPADKSTVVSIFPHHIKVVNVTLLPGKWELPAGSIEKPALLVVGSSSWFKETDINEPLLEIPQGSHQVADSIVKDYCNGIFGCDMGNQGPGIFWVPGSHTIESVKKEFKQLLEQAVVKQKNYYVFLMAAADQLWAASNGNPHVINEEMRTAARVLGHEHVDWMKRHETVGMVRCFACGSMKQPDYPICSACGVIDPEHPKAGIVMAAKRMQEPEKLNIKPFKVGG